MDLNINQIPIDEDFPEGKSESELKKIRKDLIHLSSKPNGEIVYNRIRGTLDAINIELEARNAHKKYKGSMIMSGIAIAIALAGIGISVYGIHSDSKSDGKWQQAQIEL